MDARRTDGQTDGRTVGRFHCWLSGCLEGLMDGMMHGWKDAGMDASAVRRGQLGHAEGRRSVPASSSGRGVCTSPRLEATDWHVAGALRRVPVRCVHTRGKRGELVVGRARGPSRRPGLRCGGLKLGAPRGLLWTEGAGTRLAGHPRAQVLSPTHSTSSHARQQDHQPPPGPLPNRRGWLVLRGGLSCRSRSVREGFGVEGSGGSGQIEEG